ncbi:MAG: hypothetical protein KKE71_05475, partial [Nanoarchaeota archaeon]|nr:hypothetical protein [Nanoarchaeota archaeon]
KDIQFTNDSIGKLFEININNTGKGSTNFNAKLEAPLWAYISPKEFVLQKGKNATIYVYAAPSYGTKDDAYLMKITIKNDAGFSKNEFVQLVLGNATPLDLSKLRGAPTGAVVKTTASPKSLYVIVLGIIVIAIIIFGPRLFGKKKEEEEAEMKPEFPEDIIGADKTVTMEISEEKIEEEKEVPEEEKDNEKTVKKKKPVPAKKVKKKASKKEFQDIVDNV